MRPFTCSAALRQIALDRGARLAERYPLLGDVKAWRTKAQRISQATLEQVWDAEMGSLTEQIDPSSWAFLGNSPQGFSHIGLILSGVNLARLTGRRLRHEGPAQVEVPVSGTGFARQGA